MAEKLDELKAHLLQDVQGLEEGDKDVDDLDSGAYGFVFKVSVAGLPCMAKKLHRILTNKEVSADDRKCIQGKFYDECVLLSKLSHPNIVHFVGVCYGKSESDLMLVMERLKSDLATFVEKRKNIPISIKVSTLLDVSYGLLYLHNQTPPLIHRDLTAPNILLTEYCRAKIADLGVSKFLTDPHIIKQTMAPGNLSYMAPETKIEIPQYGTSMDIFSFGHLVLHTSIQKWPKTCRVINHRKVEPGKMEIAERKGVLEKEMKKSHPLYQLAINCLQDEPKLRPSTADLNKTLNQLSTKHPKSPGDVASILEEIQPSDHRMFEQLRQEAQLMTTEKLSLQQQLEKITRELSLKEKQLEIVANEKAAMSNDIAAWKNEIAQAKTTSGRMGAELQAAQERLEIAIADTAKLHDEVIAKTAQVMQYKKQTDSFKAKVEEADTKLLKTQQELRRRQELIKTMEEDNQYQIKQAKATAASDKLVAEMDLMQSQRRVDLFERELQELRNGGEIPEAMRIEVDRRIEAEQKLLLAEAKCSELMDKCSELMDKCSTRYQAIEKLKGALAQHSIAIPAFSIDKIEKIPVLPHQSSNSRLESSQHRQPVSPVMRDSQLGQQQRGGYPRGYEQQQTSAPAFDTNRHSTEPHKSIVHVQNVTPRVHEDGAQYWEGQLPPTSQTQLPAQNRMVTGPPIRASESQYNMDYQGQQNQQMTNDPQQQPMYQYEQGGQQNQPNQWEGGHNPNQQGGFNQDPRQNQQFQQGYAQGGPSFTHHGQQHHHGHHLPPGSPNYQPQAQNYPPTSYAQGNPSSYGVNQSQQPPRGIPAPHNPVQRVSHQESPPTGRGQLAPERIQPTPLPRKLRNSKQNLPNVPRPKQKSNVDRDIKDAAKFVIHEGVEPESMAPDAPFDPNLICHQCMHNFRVGEIQKYKKHVNTCQGDLKDPEPLPPFDPNLICRQCMHNFGVGEIQKYRKHVNTCQGDLKDPEPLPPFDPNLICPQCMRNFRMGEIQKYRKHVNTCTGENPKPLPPLDPNLICPLCMRNFRMGEIREYRKHVNTCQGDLKDPEPLPPFDPNLVCPLCMCNFRMGEIREYRKHVYEYTCT